MNISGLCDEPRFAPLDRRADTRSARHETAKAPKPPREYPEHTPAQKARGTLKRKASPAHIAADQSSGISMASSQPAFAERHMPSMIA